MAKKKLLSFLDVFFNFDDAVEWRSGHIEDHLVGYENAEWFIHEDEIKLLPSGAYRAGLILINQPDQLDLFGAEQDA